MYSFESRVRYSEVDENQDLSITGIINYFQDCSTFQSEDLGLGIDYLTARQRAWWLSAWQIVIDRCPKMGEQVRISTWPYDFKGMYGYRNFTIQDMAGDYLVKASSVWFFFDTAAGRPIKAQEEDIRGYRAGDDERLVMDYAPRRIALPEEYETAEPIAISRHHIDTNHHVNNAMYVEIARETLPPDVQVKELRVEYKKAAVLGDTVYPRISRTEDGITVALTQADGNAYAVIWLCTRKRKNNI